MGVDYVAGEPLPDEVTALGARVVVEADGSETLITKEGGIYPLKDGGVITIRRDKVGYNSREKLLDQYDPDPEAATADAGARTGVT